jgi:hypothetical protein
MGKLLIGIVIGAVLGGVLTFFLFVGVPRASQRPGAPIQPPDQNAAAGTAQIVLKQEFFNEVLGTIFRDMNDPAFQLSSFEGTEAGFRPGYAAFQDQQQCDGRINILPEGSGVPTQLRFDNGRIAAPLAFAGNYNSMFGCLQFTGWAQTDLELRYDSEQQAVFGVLNVTTVNLDGVNPVLVGLVTPLVQTTLNNRVNPIKILDGKQIGINVPIASTGSNLQATVRDVRAEIVDTTLNLYVVYDFHAGTAP